MKNVNCKIDRNEWWSLLSARITAKFELVFVLAQENVFSFSVILRPTERKKTVKNGTRDF